MTLVAWAMKKFKKLRERRTWAAKFLQRIFKENPDLFVHWKEGIRDGSVGLLSVCNNT
jgi:hypothetical protein